MIFNRVRNKAKSRAVTTKWFQLGKAPDYRFSLANERTFLAWIRTALSLLAGALVISEFIQNLTSPLLRNIIAVFLSACAGLIAIYAYRRWRQNEMAMRQQKGLKKTPMLKVVSALVLLLSAILVYTILIAP